MICSRADLERIGFRSLFRELVGHAGRVVEDDDVRGSLSGRHGADEASDQEAGQQHQQAAQRQQDHLLDDEPAAIAFLRLEQELHRRPANALEAHAVDQVDEDRRADQQPAGGHVPRMQKQIHVSQTFIAIRFTENTR